MAVSTVLSLRKMRQLINVILTPLLSSHQVEISQTQWLTTNQELSYELEKALQQGKAQKSEILRLKEQLMQLQGSQR